MSSFCLSRFCNSTIEYALHDQDHLQKKLTTEESLLFLLSSKSDIWEVARELTLSTEVHREHCNNDDWERSRFTGLKSEVGWRKG